MALARFKRGGARKTFPCFDEPASKAAFQVNLGRLKNTTTLSNAPKRIEAEGMGDNDLYVWDVYHETPPISVDHLGIVFCDFPYSQAESLDHKVQIRMWSRKSVADQLQLVLVSVPVLLGFFERTFNISYPLSKLDLVALPDAGGKATENLGLITFAESDLVYKDGYSTLATKEDILERLSMALAKQWLGNLVTMKWWSE